MKEIYIVLSYSGSVLSRIIRKYTHYEFSHVSISLDKNLKNMYSFGRIYPNNPFIGGFVKECINEGTYKKFNKTKAIVYSLNVTNEQFLEINNNIKNFELKKNEYRYNFLGLIAVLLNIKWNRKEAFYCAEFVKYIMDESKIENNLPSIVTPKNFKELNGIKEIYYGLLNSYNN